MSFTPVQIKRRALFQPFLSDSSHVLELGPQASPTFLKKEVQIDYLDYFTKEQHKEWITDEQTFSKTVETDIIVTSNIYSDFVSKQYDAVIANHVLEHVEDIIGWLAEMLAVTKPGGYLFISVPDKKVGADRLRFSTSFAHVLVDFYTKGDASRLEHIFEHMLTCDFTTVGRENTPAEYMNQNKLNEFRQYNLMWGVHKHVFEGETFKDILLIPILLSGFFECDLAEYMSTEETGEFRFVLQKKPCTQKLDTKAFLTPQMAIRAK